MLNMPIFSAVLKCLGQQRSKASVVIQYYSVVEYVLNSVLEIGRFGFLCTSANCFTVEKSAHISWLHFKKCDMQDELDNLPNLSVSVLGTILERSRSDKGRGLIFQDYNREYLTPLSPSANLSNMNDISSFPKQISLSSFFF